MEKINSDSIFELLPAAYRAYKYTCQCNVYVDYMYVFDKIIEAKNQSRCIAPRWALS